MNERLSIGTGDFDGVWHAVLTVDGKATGWPCKDEEEALARAHRCAGAVRKAVQGLKLMPTPMDDVHVISDAPTRQAFDAVVALCRLHLAGAI